MPTPIAKTMREAPPLEPETCLRPHTRFGHHEEYLDHANYRRYCQNCGAESYVPGHEPSDSHSSRGVPTFEELYEVVGGCVIVEKG